MLQSFYTGNSGLNANKTWLGVISDNIANVNTNGFKQERVNFSDLVASSLTTYSSSGAPRNKEIGGGAFVAGTIKDFSQGSFKNTNQPLSLALDGEGFFMVKNPSADLTYYTRAGDFRVDANGDVINPAGLKLQGWMLDETGNIAGAMGSINIPNNLDPKNTDKVAFENPANLDAGVDAITKTFDPSDPTTYHYVNTITTYDSLGTSHVLKHYFIKTDINTWRVFTQLDDRAVTYNDGTNEYAALELKFNGKGELTSAQYISQPATQSEAASEAATDDGIFSVTNIPVLPGTIYITQDQNGNSVTWNDDGSGNIVDIQTGEIKGTISYDDGKITIIGAAGDGNTTGTLTVNYKDFSDTTTANVTDLGAIKTSTINYSDNTSRFLNNGATDTAITEDFKKLTQLDSEFIFYAQQNGASKGDLMSISVTEDGIIKGTYTNGQVKDVARLAVATFKDKEILVRKGDNLYLPNQQTFTPIIVPGGVISKIRSGMLEMSNVDISQEFINLITAQRAYQANAKTITTSDQILQTTMDIKR
ncbi:flagellar hook protein FlgE [Nitratiruptor sp. SB155-2]|uniref:flagellar hook protein FlgE n=1 Tax=Nitratiruptor sp. (strain SB155-2) TaxID=387092 RepID=UPI0001586DE3|nr:flagellar hook protein FlgE [Nitratiruptor sp. SB155-2]BAF69742.1 flagellar basal body and hook protein FlgE [Nitratiruptor sp. SB155-2]